MSHTTFVVNKAFEALRRFDSNRSEFVHHASELLIGLTIQKIFFVLFYILPYRLYHVVVLVVLGYVVYE